MWIDCFWETMVTAWEKLDIHRISKYLQVIRFVIAEAFKVVRVAGWPVDDLRTLGETFTQATPMKAKGGHNAHSLALLLQFTRIFWEELRPQMEASSSIPKPAILALLEPFCAIAEASAQESLVRHVHENIFRKAPRELFSSLMARLLACASKAETTQKNRQALYDTADTLERLAATPVPKDVKPISLKDDADGSKTTTTLPPLELPPSAKPQEQTSGQEITKKKGKKRKASKSGNDDKASTGKARKSGMSPLMLPEAAMPIDESTQSKPAMRKGKKKVKAVSVANDANPKRLKGKKKNKKS
jgi:predicted small lipoprotein YifL